MAQFKVKTADEFRDDICRTVYNAEIVRGVATPNVGPGSDVYIRAQALANQLETLSAAAIATGDRLMPDTAVGDDLRRWLNIVGTDFRPAGPSSGWIVFDTSIATTVGVGAELLTPTGARISVTVGGVYADGALIPVKSVDTGIAQNLDPNAVVRWVSPPPFAASTAAASNRGLSGGTDVEGNEDARQRLLYLLAHPAEAGNASHVSLLAENASPEIQRCFVYPGANGPSTTHFAVAGYAKLSKVRSREVSDVGVGLALAMVGGELPESMEIVGQSVIDVGADVTMVLQLPAAVTAVPAGSGDGWIDGSPWPSVAGIDPTRIFCRALTVTDEQTMRVESMIAPTGGESVCFLSYTGANAFTLYTAKILTTSTHLSPVGTTPGQYDVTLDAPLSGILANDLLFPASVRGQAYVDAVLDAFGRLGPGEKTDVPGLLPTAYRRPRPFEQYPYSLDGKMLKALEDAGPEVLSADWGYRNGGTFTPVVPAFIYQPANIFVPRRIAFYQDPNS